MWITVTIQTVCQDRSISTWDHEGFVGEPQADVFTRVGMKNNHLVGGAWRIK